MHRFLPGIILIQIISVVILWVNIPDKFSWDIELAFKVILPLLLLGISTALWFESIAKNRAATTVARLKEQHAKDREKLQARTEREKNQVVQSAHKEIVREQRRANNKANIKVSVAFIAAAGAGLVMLITELVTFGMMTLMTAGGALSGYFYRGKRESVRIDSTSAENTDTADAVVAEQGKPPIMINSPSSPKPSAKPSPKPSIGPSLKKSPIRSTDKT